MFKLTIFVSALLFTASFARHPGMQDAPTLGQEALRMASPKQQREMNRLIHHQKTLMSVKLRLDEQAPAIQSEKDFALENLQTVRQTVEETKKACEFEEGSALCGSLREKRLELVAAKASYEKVEKTMRANLQEYKENSKMLEDVHDTMLSLRTGYPRPSVPACPDGCRVVCKHSSCWCYCPTRW